MSQLVSTVLIIIITAAAAGEFPLSESGQASFDEEIQEQGEPNLAPESHNETADEQVVLEERGCLFCGGGSKSKNRRQREQEAAMAQQQMRGGGGYSPRIGGKGKGDARRQKQEFNNFVGQTKQQAAVHNPNESWIFPNGSPKHTKSQFGSPPSFYGYRS